MTLSTIKQEQLSSDDDSMPSDFTDEEPEQTKPFYKKMSNRKTPRKYAGPRTTPKKRAFAYRYSKNIHSLYINTLNVYVFRYIYIYIVYHCML